MIKTCSKCNLEKDSNQFYSGRVCKDCKKAARKSRVGCPKVAAYNKEYAKTRLHEYTPERSYKAKQRYLQNRDYRLWQSSEWRKQNPDKHRAKEAQRRARKLSATPPWLTGSQKAKINRLYKLATFMEEVTGIKYHVDHIIPLQGKTICGLHIPENLQVLRADLNLSKSNLYKE